MQEFAKEVLSVDIKDELKKSYLDYAMSVIIGRALPDARDGMKPVHRRILFAMHKLSNTYNKPNKKSARVVGDVIGKYHPHGDSAVYDAIVRMTQDFSLRYPLIEGQGNFGSIDGDSAAAMRYTEIRMQKITDQILADIEKETVSYSPNYDGTEDIPDVLPTKIPNLLINGSSGIAVGMATNMPPHNLTEVIDACIHMLNNKETSIDDLLKIIKGPDFPLGGIITGIDGIEQAYRTGQGKVYVRGKTSFETSKSGRDSIIITEIPYMVNKARMLERIAELVKEKKLEGIGEIRDESDKDGMRVVVELKKGEVPEVILNNLIKNSQLEQVFGINNVVLVDGRPKLCNLHELLEIFLDHRKEVITNRSLYELRQAKDRGHVLEGLIVAIANIDEVINIIKTSENTKVAAERLCEENWSSETIKPLLDRVDDPNICKPEGLEDGFGLNGKKYKLSIVQAKAILELRLSRLTALETDKLNDEYEELVKQIKELQEILSNESRLVEVVKEELNEVKESFGDERRTEIIEKRLTIDDADLIPEEERVFTISNNGFVKTQQLAEYRSQRRGGVGKTASALREEDFIKQVLVLNTHVQVLCFTTKGKVHWLEIYKLPIMSRTAKGRPISNVLPLEDDEKVTSFLPVDEYKDGHFVLMATQKGVVKKTALKAFEKRYAPGLRAINLDDGDKLIGTIITNGSNEVCLASKSGKAIRFKETDARPMGRSTRGVKGMNIAKEDKVISLIKVKPESNLLTLSENGYGKRTNISEFSGQKRGGKGVIALNTSERNGKMVAAVQVLDGDEVMLIGNRGTMIRTKVDQISVIGRNTQGVKVVTTREGELLVDAVGFKESLDEEE
ncbi:MAG: DNA gyrase subunit A [Gammaproteobacteria bacterium]|uniref:DNA gyrase subunit A n=1 Tax=SAR86 cluster bacterium TaxID=2030880 RepID=A0A520MW21_9GAMM|nr:MAG: DNA gyrase subunit A [SAR86 cluster bacterium]